MDLELTDDLLAFRHVARRYAADHIARHVSESADVSLGIRSWV